LLLLGVPRDKPIGNIQQKIMVTAKIY